MKNNKLNPEDQEMLVAFEEGKFQSDLKNERRTQLAKLAENTIKKTNASTSGFLAVIWNHCNAEQ